MSNFRLGRLHACPYFLEAIPRSAMVAALRLHAAHPDSTGPIRTHHIHEGLGFYLETDAHRTITAIRLL